MSMGAMQEESGVLQLPTVFSISKAAPRRRASHAFTHYFTIREDVENEACKDRLDVSRPMIDNHLRRSMVDARSTKRGRPTPMQRNDFRGIHLEGRQKRMSDREIESHLSKAPRRKTIYIPSDDTTIFTIHPGGGKQTQPESTTSRSISSSSANGSQLPSEKKVDARTRVARSLRAAPKRASLMPVQVCIANATTSTMQYGCGPGKENVPPGRTQELEGNGRNKMFDGAKPVLSHHWGPGQSCTPEASLVPPHSPSQVSKRRKTFNRPPTRRTSFAVNLAPAPPQDLSTLYASFEEERVASTGPAVKAARSRNLRSFPPMDAHGAGMTSPPFRQDLQRPELYEDDWLAPQESMIVTLVNETLDECQERPQVNAADVRGPTRTLINLYQSDDNVLLYRRIQASLVFGALSLPQNRLSLCSRLQTDFGLRQRFVCLWLDSFDLEALTIGLEVVLGQGISLNVSLGARSHITTERSSMISKKRLQALLRTSLLGEKKPTESETLRPTSKASLALLSWRKTFLKSLMVLSVLDRLKTAKLFSGLLFQPTSAFKTSKSILTALGRLLLSSTGDIHRVVSHLGFEVIHCQAPLEEYQYKVENLASDFRDGIKLMRLIGISRPSELKYPCPSRTQKLRNVRLALEAIEPDRRHGTLLPSITAEDIVDGHREKTVVLLTSILGQRSLAGLLKEVNVEAEIRRLNKRYHQALSAAVDFQGQEALPERWASIVLTVCGVQSPNTSQHITNGRLLRAVEQIYAPSMPTTLLPSTNLYSTASSASIFLTTLALPKTITEFLSPTLTCPRILPPSVSLTLLGFLCSRTLSVTKKGRAASIIQSAWRYFTKGQERKRMATRFRLACACQKVVIAKAKLEGAAIVIQWSWRRYLRRSQKKTESDLVQNSGKTGRGREKDIWTGIGNEEGASDIWLA